MRPLAFVSWSRVNILPQILVLSALKYVERDVTVLFTYSMMNVVMKVSKDLDVQMGTQDWGEFNHEQSRRTFDCRMVLRARLSVADELEAKLDGIARTQPDPELMIVKNK